MNLPDGQHELRYYDFTISEIDFYKTLAAISKGNQKEKVLFRSEVFGKEVFQSWIAPAKGTNSGRPFDCIIEVFHLHKAFLGVVYFSMAEAPNQETDYEVACRVAKQMYQFI